MTALTALDKSPRIRLSRDTLFVIWSMLPPREISLCSSLMSRLFTRFPSSTARFSTVSPALSTAESLESETLKPEGLELLLSDLERLSPRPPIRMLPRRSENEQIEVYSNKNEGSALLCSFY